MGFDDIDKAYRPKPKIKLECVHCGADDNGVVVVAIAPGEELALCLRCRAAQFADDRTPTAYFIPAALVTEIGGGDNALGHEALRIMLDFLLAN